MGTAYPPSSLPAVDRVAKMIDHSLLRPDLTDAQVTAGLHLAARYRVASVCVRPCDVPAAVAALAGSGVPVGTVVGFPHGCGTTAGKAAEALAALDAGATELDMVLNIAALRSGRLDDVAADIGAVVDTGAPLVKVILENAYLTDAEKRHGCAAAVRAGAHFVKTSTGFGPGGATVADVRLMRAAVPAHVGVKAAGGVRTLDVLLEFVAAGASRFGATATATILDDLAGRHTRPAPLPNHRNS